MAITKETYGLLIECTDEQINVFYGIIYHEDRGYWYDMEVKL